MTAIHIQQAAVPFDGAAAYLEALTELLAQKVIRVALEFEAAEKEREAVTSLAIVDHDRGPLDEKIRQVRAVEDRLQAQFDGRVDASRAAGRLPTLEAIADDADLGATERLILRLVTVAAVSMKFTSTLVGLTTLYFGLDVNPEAVAALVGLDTAGRIELRRLLGEDSMLIKAGLVEIERRYEDRPAGFWSSPLHVGARAFDRIVGLDTGTKDPCPRCGHAG